MTGDVNEKAEQVLAEAAVLPSAGQVRDLADRAVARGGTRDMSIDDIRDLADRAVAGAEELTGLMRRLSELLADPGRPGGVGVPRG